MRKSFITLLVVLGLVGFVFINSALSDQKLSAARVSRRSALNRSCPVLNAWLLPVQAGDGISPAAFLQRS